MGFWVAVVKVTLFAKPVGVVFWQIRYADTMKPYLVFPVEWRTLPGQFVKIQIGGNSRVVVDVPGGARQAVEVSENESTNAMELKGLVSILSKSCRKSFQGEGIGRLVWLAGILKMLRPHVGEQIPVSRVLGPIRLQP